MIKLKLKNCPFCGQPPEIEPWHAGAPTKVMIACPADRYGEGVECAVNPSVTGETPAKAAAQWNNRDYRGDASRVYNYDENRRS